MSLFWTNVLIYRVCTTFIPIGAIYLSGRRLRPSTGGWCRAQLKTNFDPDQRNTTTTTTTTTAEEDGDQAWADSDLLQ